MPGKEYRFNPETLTYEEVREPLRLRIYRLLRKGLVVIITVCIVNLLFSFVFHTPKMDRIARENEELLLRYALLDDRIREDDRISITGLRSFAPGSRMTVTLLHSDGTSESFEAAHTYNEQQIGWFKAGSALNVKA